ncbi:MAG: NAD(P)H-dependent oxidoreductase [Deltaproteobacteria bacterium]|nr:NAD(P)H-dependent oxidoreductase [Deltaproteobacteria bacterium]
MLALGLNGSPRKGGNTEYLLSAFLNEIEKHKIATKTIRVSKKTISPCTECGYCEENDGCIIKDDMSAQIYPLLKEADIIVAAAPIFFYGFPAQFKALIDRSQALWAKKYFLGIEDPKKKSKKGFLLSLGATKGKNLFNGVKLTAKYFFDAISAKPAGDLCYFKVEKPGEITKIKGLEQDIKKAVYSLLTPLKTRKKIFFICSENACRSQIAAAYAQYFAGDKIEALSAGSAPAEKIDDITIQAMAEEKIDISDRKPKSIKKILLNTTPDIIVSMGCKDKCPYVSGADTIEWNLPDPAGKSIEFVKKIREDIKNKILDFINNI